MFDSSTSLNFLIFLMSIPSLISMTFLWHIFHSWIPATAFHQLSFLHCTALCILLLSGRILGEMECGVPLLSTWVMQQQSRAAHAQGRTADCCAGPVQRRSLCMCCPPEQRHTGDGGEVFSWCSPSTSTIRVYRHLLAYRRLHIGLEMHLLDRHYKNY